MPTTAATLPADISNTMVSCVPRAKEVDHVSPSISTGGILTLWIRTSRWEFKGVLCRAKELRTERTLRRNMYVWNTWLESPLAHVNHRLEGSPIKFRAVIARFHRVCEEKMDLWPTEIVSSCNLYRGR
jgi:hypothetical protein